MEPVDSQPAAAAETVKTPHRDLGTTETLSPHIYIHTHMIFFKKNKFY